MSLKIRQISTFVAIFALLLLTMAPAIPAFSEPTEETVDRRIQALDLIRQAEVNYKMNGSLTQAFNDIAQAVRLNGEDFTTVNQAVKLTLRLGMNNDVSDFLLPLLQKYFTFDLAEFDKYNERFNYQRLSLTLAQLLYDAANEQTDGTRYRLYYREAIEAINKHINSNFNKRMRTDESGTFELLCILKLSLEPDENTLQECIHTSARRNRFASPKLANIIAKILSEQERYSEEIDFLEDYLNRTWIADTSYIYPYLIEAYEKTGQTNQVRDYMYLLENNAGQEGKRIALFIKINKAADENRNEDALILWKQFIRDQNINPAPSQFYRAMFLARMLPEDHTILAESRRIIESVPNNMRTTPEYWRVYAEILLYLGIYDQARDAALKALTWNPNATHIRHLLHVIDEFKNPTPLKAGKTPAP